MFINFSLIYNPHFPLTVLRATFFFLSLLLTNENNQISSLLLSIVNNKRGHFKLPGINVINSLNIIPSVLFCKSTITFLT